MYFGSVKVLFCILSPLLTGYFIPYIISIPFILTITRDYFKIGLTSSIICGIFFIEEGQMQNTEDRLKKINQEIETNNIKIYFAYKFFWASLVAGVDKFIDFDHFLSC